MITGMLVIFAICLLLTVIAVTDLSAAYLRRRERDLARGRRFVGGHPGGGRRVDLPQ